MDRRVVIGGLALGGAVVLGLALWLGRPTPPQADDGPPNLVLVLGCSVRKDQTSLHGGPATTTPVLAGLAAQGAWFDDVIASSSWTRESTAAMITGRSALSWGLADPADQRSDRMLPSEAVTLAERLHEAGYRTLAITANPNLNAEFGMAQGFESAVDAHEKAFASRHKVSGQQVVEQVDRLLGEDDRRPVYLRLMLIDSHTPNRPPADEWAPFAVEGTSEKIAKYQATLARTDTAVGDLDMVLARHGLDASNTVLAFVTDHGDGLGHPPHHLGAHGRNLYPSTVESMWVMRGPGVAAGHRITGLASHEDVMPTLLELLGLPAEDDMDGRSLLAAVTGDVATTGRERAFSSTWFDAAEVAAVWTPERQCQLNTGEVVKRGHVIPSACFDRAADPEFLHPFLDPALQEELAVWREARLIEHARWDAVDAQPDAATTEQLEALGYTD